ncbi:MAG: hypothetical protein QOK49_433 [Baekduia sp.]|jgi:hypothetical protein|nr:hypothetical protein [Baekduia sp.]
MAFGWTAAILGAPGLLRLLAGVARARRRRQGGGC